MSPAKIPLLRVASPIPLVLTAVALCQCASGPPPGAEYPLQPGDAVAIVYDSGGAVLALQNASSPDSKRAPARGQVAAKVTSDAYMKGLLGRWDELGYFDAANTAVHPQAKASLTLVINSQRYACSQLPLAMSSVGEVERFNQFAIAFRTIYDNTQGYQSANLDARDFYLENERLQRNAQKATSGRGDR